MQTFLAQLAKLLAQQRSGVVTGETGLQKTAEGMQSVDFGSR
jgi:hypothetical protein